MPPLADGGFRAFVRFPPGWRRAVAGSYSVAEEILILEGALAMNGATWREGAHLWAPAGATRESTGADEGCLAFAWFGGPPRWRRGTGAGAVVGLSSGLEARPAAESFGAEARLLRAGPPHESWLLADDWVGEAAGAATEWLRLSDRSWGVAAAGQRLAVAAPAFLRVLP